VLLTLFYAENPAMVSDEAYNMIHQGALHLDYEKIDSEEITSQISSILSLDAKKYVDVRITLMQASACKLPLKYHIAQIMKKEIHDYATDQAKDCRQRWNNYLLMNDMRGFFTDPDVIQWYVFFPSLSNLCSSQS
jgi:hypothetical protein